MLQEILAFGWAKALIFGLATMAILIVSILPIDEGLEDEDV